jgi:flagellar biosynthesis protein FliQ
MSFCDATVAIFQKLKMAVELTMTFRPKVVLAFDRLEEPGTFIRAQVTMTFR